MPKIEIGISVKILPAQEYSGSYTDKIGVVKQAITARNGNRVGVEFPNLKNRNSRKGLFWFSIDSVEPLHPLDFEGLPTATAESLKQISRRSANQLPFPDVKRVIYSGPKTIVLWEDGTKTIVSCGEGESYDHYTGFCAAVTKKLFGSTSHAKKVLGRVIHVD